MANLEASSYDGDRKRTEEIIMAMSHKGCDHPATPAARAKCRKAGGPRVETIESFTTGKLDVSTACPGGDGHHEHLALNGECPWCGAGKEAPQKPRKARSTRGGIPAGYVRRDDPTRALKAEHDLADVPHAFSAVIRWAWERGFEVRTANPYNDTERRVEIKTPNGVGTLVWRHTTPNGVHGQFWRPVGTSVHHMMVSVNQLMRVMDTNN